MNDRDAAQYKNKRKKSQHEDAGHMQYMHGYCYQQQHEGHEVPLAPKMSKSPQRRIKSKMNHVAATTTAALENYSSSSCSSFHKKNKEDENPPYRHPSIMTNRGGDFATSSNCCGSGSSLGLLDHRSYTCQHIGRQQGDHQHNTTPIKNNPVSLSPSYSSLCPSSSGKGRCSLCSCSNCCSVYPSATGAGHNHYCSYQQPQPQPFVLRQQQQEHCDVSSIEGVKVKNSCLSYTEGDDSADSTGSSCKYGPLKENSSDMSPTAAGHHQQQHSMHQLCSCLKRQSCGRISWVVPTAPVQTLQYNADNSVEQQQGLQQSRLVAVENIYDSEEDTILKWAITTDVQPSSPTNLNKSNMTLMNQEENGLLLDSELDVTLGMDLDLSNIFDNAKQVTHTENNEQVFVDSIIAAEEVMPALSKGNPFQLAHLNPSSQYFKEGHIQTSKDAKSNNMNYTKQPVVGQMFDTNSTQYYPDVVQELFHPLSTNDTMSKPNHQHLDDETNNREMLSDQHLVNDARGNKMFEYSTSANEEKPRYSSDVIQDESRELCTYPYSFISSFVPSTDNYVCALDKNKIITRGSNYSTNFLATYFYGHGESHNKESGGTSKEWEHVFCSATLLSSCKKDDSISKSVNLCWENSTFTLPTEEQAKYSTGYFRHLKTSSQTSTIGNYDTSTNGIMQREGNTVQNNYVSCLDPELFCLLHQSNITMPSYDHIPILAHPNYFDHELVRHHGYKSEVIRFNADDINAKEDQHCHPIKCQNPQEHSACTTSNHTCIPYVTGPKKNSHCMQTDAFNHYAPLRSYFLDSLSPEIPSSFQAKLPPHYMMRKVIPLSTKNDKKWLSKFQCFIRSQCMEVFSASSNDVASRMSSKRVSLNQVGIRCRFCAHLPYQERSNRSSSFPSSISKLYHCATMMVRDHFPRCKEMPPSVLHDYRELDEECKKSHSAPDSKSFWMKSAQENLGLIDTDDGIRYCLISTMRRNSK